MSRAALDTPIYSEVIKFLAIGVFNTAVGTFLMFLFYNFFKMGYWGSSAASYFIASIFSFLLNKKITFKNNETFRKTTPKFFINIAICYVIAYLIAKPMTRYFLNSINIERIDLVEQAALLLGICLFTLMNFIGQKYFVFKERLEL